MSRTVLLIDYEPRSITHLEGLLEGWGYRTTVARDGVAGIEEFARSSPDITLVRELIPRKHGFDVCRELKETAHGRTAPVVLLASGRGTRRHELIRSRCDAFVERPIVADALLETLRRLLPDDPAATPPETSEEQRRIAV
jgi:CheY-like chemotaxis protein